MTEAALMAHLLAQTQANISFLQQHGYLNVSDATDIQSKLATASASGGRTNNRVDSDLASHAQNLGISPPMPTPTPPTASSYQPAYHAPPPPSQYQSPPPASTYHSPPPPPPQDTTVKARALWSYNEDQREANDLSFSSGEVIEIVKEVNADWWEGRVRGRQGLFPSNYVEKMATDPEKRGYKPFMAAYHGSDVPPAPAAGATNSVGLQEAPGQEKKKNKFGSLGNTLAHSAAGGVGFGAGVGLVSAIF